MPVDEPILPISLEQQKLIASALRTRILHVTSAQALTAKQVARELGETPGNVHYHLQRLLRGGLVEIVETRTRKGIVEKYYQAKSTRFLVVGEAGKARPFRTMTSHMSLTDEESDRMVLELAEVLHRWEQAAARKAVPDALPRRIEFTISPVQEED